MDIRRVYDAVRARVVGRERETQLILAALEAGRDLLLEGPPGTSKSTILRAICASEGISFHFVEGNADLTPTKLIGHHSPAEVMRDGYSPDNFVQGPLPRAMREGGMLYIEELNRVPEDTLNTLIGAMAERELAVPRVGILRAESGFRVISAMNPFDNIGTVRLSGALTDRLCRIRTGYQGADEERLIVAEKTGRVADDEIVAVAVEVARRSREHPDLRMGASIRAAIDFALVASRMRSFADAGDGAWGAEGADEALVAAAKVAFSIKVGVRESARRSDDEVVEEIVRSVLEERRADGRGGRRTPPRGESRSRPKAEAPPPRTRERGQNHQGPKASSGEDAARVDTGDGAGGSPRASADPLRRAPGARPDRPAPDAFSPALAGGVAGRLLSPGEARREVSRGRGRGDRRFHRVAAEHPGLAARVDAPGAGPDDLLSAVEDSGGDVFEVLGSLLRLGDRQDLRALARRVANALVIDEARRDPSQRSARGRLVSQRYREGMAAVELDLDTSLGRLLATPFPRDEDFVVRERRHHRRSYALMLDVSGSMVGGQIFHAALAVASLAVRVGADDPFAVVAFWRDAVRLKALDERVDLDHLLEQLWSLSGSGLTDLGLALRTALEELAGARTEERVGILFSDGLHTAGEPPGPLAAAFSTLHVVGTGDSPEAEARCRELAELGHGRCGFVRRPEDVAAVVGALLAG